MHPTEGAERFLFSDHGERFYHAPNGVQLCGVHGYNLDPWETRVMFKVAGPGFSGSGPTIDHESTVSLLAIKDAVGGLVLNGVPITPETLTRPYPQAPLRYHTVSASMFTDEPAEYKQMNLKELVEGSYIAPYGIWFTQYKKSVEERSRELTIGTAVKDRLVVFKPLAVGGAHRYEYDGFRLKAVTTVDQATYEAELGRVGQLIVGPSGQN